MPAKIIRSASLSGHKRRGVISAEAAHRARRQPGERAVHLMGGEDLGDILACVDRRPAAGESTLNPPTQGDQEATALRSTDNQKICRTKTMIINGSRHDPAYRGKFEHAPWISKRLNKIKFLAGSGIARSGRLFL